MRHIPAYPNDIPADKRLWIEMKAASLVNDDVMLVPAVPGSLGIVLSFGRPPDFLCDSVTVSAENADDVQAITNALRTILLGERPGMVLRESEWLSAVLGVEVKEVAE